MFCFTIPYTVRKERSTNMSKWSALYVLTVRTNYNYNYQLQ